MWKIILLTALLVIVDVKSDEQVNCVRNVEANFKVMIKHTKIFANGKKMRFYGFDKSAENLIKLDMSKTGYEINFHNVSFHNLMVLEATHNNYKHISDGIGNETYPSLRIFNFAFNALTSIKTNVLLHMKEIEILNLSFNCITHIDSNAFTKLENLKELHLQNNLMTSFGITTDQFHTRKLLKVLDLSYNHLKRFLDEGFEIDTLKLRENKIESLSFNNAHANMNLDVSHNQLTFFDAGQNTFISLNLSHNYIKDLSDVNFNSAFTVDLSNNKMICDKRSLTSYTYENSKNFVTNLNISNNQLENVFDVFRNFNIKTSLILNNNLLSNISFEDFKLHFPQIEIVSLKGNPLTSVDEHELKFHKETRFLPIHFEYDFTTKTPSTSKIVKNLINSTTTTDFHASITTTTQITINKEPNKSNIIPHESSTIANSTSSYKKGSISSNELATKIHVSTQNNVKNVKNEVSKTTLIVFVVLIMIISMAMIFCISSFIENSNLHTRVYRVFHNEFENNLTY